MKKLFLFSIPVSICNFRCHYCYLGQRDVSFQGVHPQMKYSPEEFGKAMNLERVGGASFGNFCADGETLLVRDIDLYVKEFVAQGHYAEVVTNLTVTKVLDKFLLWDKELLKRVEFKCSFHYLELKRKGLLDVFAENVNKIWNAGASANIEITPNDELISHIDELKDFSIKNFGALPHLTIARDDRTEGIEYLTKLSMKEYDRIWEQFDSDFWKFKKTIFGVKQKEFCYAGKWSLYINLCTGIAVPCYCGGVMGDVFANPSLPFPEKAVGSCPIAHCYNGHALLTMGLIPNVTEIKYGDIRDRVKTDGTHWLQPELKEFFNTKLLDSNIEFSKSQQIKYIKKKSRPTRRERIDSFKKLPNRMAKKILGEPKYNALKKSIKGGK